MWVCVTHVCAHYVVVDFPPRSADAVCAKCFFRDPLILFLPARNQENCPAGFFTLVQLFVQQCLSSFTYLCNLDTHTQSHTHICALARKNEETGFVLIRFSATQLPAENFLIWMREHKNSLVAQIQKPTQVHTPTQTHSHTHTHVFRPLSQHMPTLLLTERKKKRKKRWPSIRPVGLPGRM